MIPRSSFSSAELERRRRRRENPTIRREHFNENYRGTQYVRDPRFRRYYHMHPQQNRRVYMRTHHTNTLAARRGQTDDEHRRSIIGFRNVNPWVRDRIDSYL